MATETKPLRLVSIGEILWDLFPAGAFIGGASFNLAAHAARLGNESYLLSAVGDDDHGRRAHAELRRLGVRDSLIQVSARYPTGTVTVAGDTPEEAVYTIRRPAAYDDLRADAEVLQILRALSPQWVTFGTLYAHHGDGLQTLRKLLEASPGRCFYDVNLRDGHYDWDTVETLLLAANVVKLNEHELKWVARQAGLSREHLATVCEELAREFAVHTVCVTRGGEGCAVFQSGDFLEVSGEPVTVVSTVGAGDSFSAMFLHGLASGWPLSECARRANRLGAFVATHTGAVPEYAARDFLNG
jgi:fructokinase